MPAPPKGEPSLASPYGGAGARWAPFCADRAGRRDGVIARRGDGGGVLYKGVIKGGRCVPVARVQRPTEPAGETALPPPLELNYSTFSPSHAGRLSSLGNVCAWEGVSERRWRSAANRPSRQARPGGGQHPARTRRQVRPECGQRKAQLSSDCAFDACLLARMRGPPARVPSGIIFHRKIMPTLLRCFLRSLRSWDSVPHPASFLKKA